MTLEQAWADSLTLLKPKNFKLFALVTLKTIVSSFVLFLKYWWWLPILSIGILYLIHNADSFVLLVICTYFSLFLDSITLPVMCLITRPSVMQKNCSYFRTYYKQIIFFMIGRLIPMIPLALVLQGYIFFGPLFFTPFWVFLCLFFLDSDATVIAFYHSTINAVKMCVFNFPLYGCIVLFYGFFCFIYKTVFPVSSIPHNFVSALFITLPIQYSYLVLVCICTNIYIKKLHDQWNIYFPKHE